MSNPVNCACPCPTPETVNIAGLQGQSAFTFTSADFLVPALGGAVTVTFLNTDWMSVGQTIFIEGAGLFTVTAIVDSTHATITYQNIAANTASGNTISSGAQASPAGLGGTNGTSGGNSYTVTTAGFTVPAIGANVSVPDGFIHVASTAWMGVGQIVFISDGTDFGSFRVVSITNPTAFVAEYLGFAGESAPGVTVDSGASVSPGGTQLALSAPLPTVLTDNSTGTASNTIAAGVGISTLTIPLTSLATGLSTAALDLLTGYVPGYRFKLLAFDFVTTIVGAGAGASQVFNLEIGAVNVTGGVLTVNLASTDTIGEITSGTAITAANIGTAADSISLEMAVGGTAFTSGSGYFVIRIQNMDTADSIASLSDHINDLIASLT